MKFTGVLLALSAFGCANAAGSGPYPAEYTTDPALPNHTIYRPSTIPSCLSLPVVIWGNGGCSADGTSSANFLHEIASHGFYVIANGLPNGGGRSTSALQAAALDWVGGAGAGTVDGTRVAVAGYSCGGLEAYEFAGDERVDVLGIFNSGFLDDGEAQRTVPGIQKPVLYLVGGESDIAYANSERDYRLLSDSTPAWKGNLDVGHGGTYGDPNGGAYGVAAVNFFKWTLNGDQDAAAWFTEGGAEQAGWQVEAQALSGI